MKKILLIGNVTGVFVQSLTKNLLQLPDTEVDLLSTNVTNQKKIFGNLIHFSFYDFYNQWIRKGSSYVFLVSLILWTFSKRIKKEYYNTVQIHYMSTFHSKYIPLYKKIAKCLVGVFWGSDLFKFDNKNKLLKMVKFLDVVNFSTTEMESFYSKNIGTIPVGVKISNCRFGLEIFTQIDKLINYERSKLIKILQINKDYDDFYIITLGYNGHIDQQHLEVIDSTSELKEIKKILWLLPFTYGKTQKYYENVKSKLDGLGYNYLFFTEFMTGEQVAALRCISDIFIQVRKTDALSASTQEHLYAGNNVIVGSWLPYNFLVDNGIKYETIDSIRELKNKLQKIIDKIKPKEKSSFHEENKKILDRVSSWNSLINEWHSL